MQDHFLVTLLKFFDMRDSSRYVRMAFFRLFLFRHFLFLCLSDGSRFRDLKLYIVREDI
jgi:hypothetical protein